MKSLLSVYQIILFLLDTKLSYPCLPHTPASPCPTFWECETMWSGFSQWSVDWKHVDLFQVYLNFLYSLSYWGLGRWRGSCKEYYLPREHGNHFWKNQESKARFQISKSKAYAFVVLNQRLLILAVCGVHISRVKVKKGKAWIVKVKCDQEKVEIHKLLVKKKKSKQTMVQNRPLENTKIKKRRKDEYL